MGSITSSNRRCSSDATSENRARRLMVFCDICGKPKFWTRMIVDDDGGHGFMHRRCIAGALGWERQNGSRIRVDRLNCPVATADSGAQTDDLSTIGSTVDRARVATCNVACGDFKVKCADGCTQTNVATIEVASGDETVYVDGCTQANVATIEVASGNEIVYVDVCTQVNVAISEIASDDEIVYLDGCTQASPATSEVASGDKTVYMDGSTQADVAICLVTSGVGVEYVNGPALTDDAVVRNKTRTMADKMSQIVNGEISVGVHPALAVMTKFSLSPSTEPKSSKTDTQLSE